MLFKGTVSKPYPIQSTSSHPKILRSILILSFYLLLGISSGLFLSSFPTNILMHHLYHACYMFRPSQTPSFYEFKNIWRRV